MSITKSQFVTVALALLVVPLFSGGHDVPFVLAALLICFLSIVLVVRLKPIAIGWSGITIPALGLIVWSALSILWSVNRFQTISWAVIMILLMAAFILAYQIRGNAKLVQLWTRLYLGIATLFSIFGIGLYLTQSYDRFTSTIYWANPAAGYLIPAVFLAWWYWLENKKWPYAAAAIITSAGFMLTFSRGALIISALGGVVVLASLRRPARYWINLASVLAISAFLVVGLNWTRTHVFHQSLLNQGSRFSEAAKGESVSVQDRVNYLKSTVAIWRDYPILGTGAGTYGTVHPQYQLRVISATTNAHNMYAQLVSELGDVGFVLVLVLLWQIWLAMRRTWSNDRDKRPLIIVAAILLLHFGIEIDNSYPAILLLGSILLGLIYTPPQRSNGDPVYRWALPLILLCAIATSFSAYMSAQAVKWGDASADNHEYEQAIEYYQVAHSGWSALVYDPDVITKEGIMHFTLNAVRIDPAMHILEAERLARIATKQDPLDPQHQFLLARILREDSLWDRSRAAYLQAIKLDPYNHPDFYSDLAELELQQGRDDEASRYVEQGIALYPDVVIGNRLFIESTASNIARLYLDRAIIKHKAGDPEGVLRAINRALEIDPGNAAAKALPAQLSSS